MICSPHYWVMGIVLFGAIASILMEYVEEKRIKDTILLREEQNGFEYAVKYSKGDADGRFSGFYIHDYYEDKPLWIQGKKIVRVNNVHEATFYATEHQARKIIKNRLLY